jgi:hypothetical protein
MSSNRILIAGSRLTDLSLLGNLAQYIDLSNPANFGNPSNGSAVSGTFTDLSGNGLGMQAAQGARQPIFQTGINNGLGACLFDGSDDELVLGGDPVNLTNIAANRAALTIYAVFKQAGAPTARQALWLATTGNNIVVKAEHRTGSPTSLKVGSAARTQNADSLVSVASTTDAGTSMQCTFARINFSAGTIDVGVNGIVEGSDTLASSGNSQNTNGRLAIGGNSATAANFNGHIFGIVVYHGAHDLDQRRAVTAHLRNLYRF